jgi:hypothetical protein
MSARRNAASNVLNLKTGDAIPVEGFLPLRKFFLGEHVAVVGFAPAKYPAANHEHDRGFPPSTPPSRTGCRELSCEVKRGLFGRRKFAHLD